MSSSAPVALDNAIAHLNAGNLPAAEAALQSLLQLQPNSPEAVHLLGLVRHKQGHPREAIGLMQRSIELNPDHPDFHNNLGEAFRGAGDLPAAEQSYRRALAIRPNFPEATANLGLLRVAERDLIAAEQLFRDAIAMSPAYADAHQHLGNALREQNRHPEALESFRRAVQLRPHYPKAWHRIGLTFQAMRRHDDALQAFKQAVTQQPDLAEAWFEMGSAFKDIGRLDLAAECWERTIPVAAHSAGACVNLAHVRTRQGLLSEAVTLLNRAVAQNPDIAAGYNNLGNALADQGKLDEAVAAYRAGLARHPDDFIAHSNLLFVLNHHPAYPPDKLFAEHLAWAHQHTSSLSPSPHPPTSPSDAQRPLRIGYVSADFRDNQVGFFLEPLLANHDHKNFWIKCYSDVDKPDAVTDRMRRMVDAWEDILPLSDERLAEHVREDRIDVLVDLTVHAGKHRLLTFARKPAPIQLTYLGYPNTTGLSAIDYRLTDVHLDPPDLTESHHAEKLLRLPDTYFCYRPPAGAPKVSPLPYLKTGRITFGSFNRLIKVTDPTIALWSQVLHAVPRSRLTVKAQGMSDEPTKQHLASRFAAHGITPDRLDMQGWSDVASYLSLMSQVDIALDPFPFAGGTTTCHLLWMGVPVVTLAGPSPVHRIGVSLLTNVQLPDLIAQSEDDYLRIATTLAKDTPRLSKLRATLRDRVRTSPLLDAARFARNVESAYRAAWARYCAGQSADHIAV